MNDHDPVRRNFLHIVTGCGLVGLCVPGCARPQQSSSTKALTESDKIDIGGQGQAIIEKARSLGREYHSQYGGCSQTSLMAIQDSVPFVPKDEMVVMAAAPLSGGATRTRNASCGAFTGCGLAIGSVCGRSRATLAAKPQLAGKLMLEINDRFVETWGSVLCSEIRPKVDGKCAEEVVSRAAAWGAEVLLKQFTNYQG